MSDDATIDAQNVTTPNLALNKPTVGGDDDIWGGLLNANCDVLDTAITNLRTEVVQLSGALLFIGTYDVVADYAEFAAASGFPNGPLPPADAANFNSYLIATTAGTGHGNAPAVAFNKGDWLVSDGAEWVHLALGIPPGGAVAASTVTVTPAVQGATNVQTALQQLDQAQAGYLPLAGGNMTGPVRSSLGTASAPAVQIGAADAGFWKLAGSMFVNAGSVTVMQLQGASITFDVPVILPADPAANMQAATKQYVDNKVSVSNPLMDGAVAIGTATTYARADHVHPSDTSRAPLISPAFSGNPTSVTPAPGDNDTSIATTAFVQNAVGVTPAANNIGRNLLHNPLFNVAQRGNGPWTVNSYSLDRWNLQVSSDTVSVIRVGCTDADRAAIGDETAIVNFQNVFTGNAAAGAFNFIQQSIENIRRLSGKTTTVSFWAKAAAGTPKLGINLVQAFGTGGSPSPGAWIGAQTVTLSTTWTRYTATFAIPSTAGKTLGTNGDDATGLAFWFSSGATQSAVAGGIGVQSGTVSLWGVQLEIGSVVTPLEKPDPRYDLANCQRFFQFYTGIQVYQYAAAGSGVSAGFALPVQMRAVPTPAFGAVTYVNASGAAVLVSTGAYFGWQWIITATGSGAATIMVSLSADL